MADILAGIAPQKDTYANWVTLNPTLGKTDSGNDYSQMIFATGSPVGDILIWGMAQSFTVAYGLGQYLSRQSLGINLTDTADHYAATNIEDALLEIATNNNAVPHPPYDISTANTLITVPTITGYAQKHTYYWTGGDGSNTFKFVTGTTIGGIDSALWVGDGEGHITIESDGTNYQVREYEDSGSNSDGTYYKKIDGSAYLSRQEDIDFTTAINHEFALPLTPITIESSGFSFGVDLGASTGDAVRKSSLSTQTDWYFRNYGTTPSTISVLLFCNIRWRT